MRISFSHKSQNPKYEIKILPIKPCVSYIWHNGCASVDEDGNLADWVWIIIGFLIITVIAAALQTNYDEKKKREKAASDRERGLKQEAEQKARFDGWYSKYIAENGTPDKTIIVKPNDEMEIIQVHEAKKQVYLKGKMYAFKDFISVTFTDSPTIIKGNATRHENNRLIHDYTIIINMNSIANPIVRINIGSDGKTTNEIVGLINVILSRR